MYETCKINVKNVVPLADVFYCEFQIMGFNVVGETDVTVRVPEMGFVKEIRLKAVAAFTDMTGEDVGVLMAGPGDLMLLGFYSDFSKETEVWLVDASRLTGNRPSLVALIKNCRSRGGAHNILKGAIVKEWTRLRAGGGWTKTK